MWQCFIKRYHSGKFGQIQITNMVCIINQSQSGNDFLEINDLIKTLWGQWPCRSSNVVHWPGGCNPSHPSLTVILPNTVHAVGIPKIGFGASVSSGKLMRLGDWLQNQSQGHACSRAEKSLNIGWHNATGLHGACMGLLGDCGMVGAGDASKSHADSRRTNSSGVGPPSGTGDSSPSPGKKGDWLLRISCVKSEEILS